MKSEIAIILIAISVGAGIIGLSFFLSPSNSNYHPENTIKGAEILPSCENYLNREIYSSPVHGTSMEPTFGGGDNIIWVKVEPGELDVGDIIIYEHPTEPETKYVAHRVIDIKKIDGEYRFETKGDNRAKSDAKAKVSSYYVAEGDLKGLVIGVVQGIS